MKDLLSPEHEDCLVRLATQRTLIAFDFDGTLAPIVPAHDDAYMREHTSALFAQVCERYPCAVISGRALADVAPRLGTARVGHVIGNHGAEPGMGLDVVAHEMARARHQLGPLLECFPDIELEDKRYSLSLHYRQALHKEHALAAIVAAVSRLGPFIRIVPGKLVINVVSGRARNKGDALLALWRSQPFETALYIGDDITDEDVFAHQHPRRLIGVRVGESRASAAGYFVQNQAAVDTLLKRLSALRD